MDSILQLKTFIFSFLYGVLFFIMAKCNLYFIKNKCIFWQFIINMIFVLDMVLIYYYINYRLNNGCFHIYFLLTIGFGYIVMLMYFKKIAVICKKYVKRIKKSKK